MALIQCPDCGKMISGRAKACPECGCPAEFFNTAEEKGIQKTEELMVGMQDDKKIVFRFGGQEFVYLKEDADCIKAIGYYLVMAEMIKYMAEIAYDRLDGIGAVLREFPLTMDTFLQENIYDVTVKLFYRMGDSISMEQFVRKYENRYTMQYEAYYSEIVEKYAEIRHEEAELAEYRSAVKASRGRWTGGGFGLKGAVKGAITAGMLNRGSDFLHSFGDAADERRDNQEIKKRLKELYDKPWTKRKLSDGMHACVLNIMEAVRDEMVEIGALSPEVEIDYDKAVTLYNNTLKWEGDKETLYKNMAQCIRYYPINPDFYQKLEPAIKDSEEKDVSGFIEFWGFHDLLAQYADKGGTAEWDLKCTLDMYYEQYKKFQLSDCFEEEKRRALHYKESRDKESVQLADNIRRRFGPLTQNIDETELINTSLYMIRSEFKPEALKNSQGIDQYVFCDNGEIVVTDYAIMMPSEPIELTDINEIWYGKSDDAVFLVRIMLKNSRECIDKKVMKKSSIDILTLLNIALEPYREITYRTAFDSELLDMYTTLHNDEEVLALDNEEDRAKKKLIEDEQKKLGKEEARRYNAESRTDRDVEFSAAIRRRFQMLFSRGIVEDDYIVNKYIYELEAENLAVSKITRKGGCKPDEILLYADEVCVITDYTLCVVGYDNKQSNFPLSSINEIYYSEYKLITVTLKGEGKNKDQANADRIKIETDFDKNHKGVIFFFLSIVLEPYRDINYIQEIQDICTTYCPDEFIREFEEKESFSDFIENVLDDESDKTRKQMINAKAEERMEIRKRAAESYQREHINPSVDKFGEAFAVLYPFIYEKYEKMEKGKRDIKYFSRYRNCYDYEIYEYLPKNMKKMLSSMQERGERILWGGDNILLTDRHININGYVFCLYDIKEILCGRTIQAVEADSGDRRADTDVHYLIQFRNGSVTDLKLDMPSEDWKVWYPLNYALKVLHNCGTDIHFLWEQGYFCGQCNSFNVTQEEGFFGKKYRCTRCDNRSKKSIILFKNDKKVEINEEEVAVFISFNKLDMEFEKPRQMQAPMALCKICGKQIAGGIKFCNYCGQMVEENSVINKKMLCAHCGKEILVEAKFCNFCGKPNRVDLKDGGAINDN